MIAHISWIPVEELAPVAGGTSTLLMIRAWLRTRVREKMKR